MEYRNTKTGAVICTDCECCGEDWEAVEPSPAPEAPATKKGGASNGKRAVRDRK